MQQLKWDNADTRYAVFDDFSSIKFLPLWKFWMGAQANATVTDKYKGKMDFKWGRPIIWCSNYNIFDDEGLKDHDADWIRANAFIVTIDSPLFSVHANTE